MPNTACKIPLGIISVSPLLRIYSLPPTVNLPVPSSTGTIGIRKPNRRALKALFSPYSGAFLLAIRKYCTAWETLDYAKTKAFRVLCSFKTSYFCRYKEKTKQCCRLARLFDAVTAKRGHFKTVFTLLFLALPRSTFVRRRASTKRRKRRLAFD